MACSSASSPAANRVSPPATDAGGGDDTGGGDDGGAPNNTDGGPGAGQDAPGGSNPKWTIFVYGHGDHTLSASLDTDIAKMDAARLTPNVNVVVMADWDASRTRASGGNFPDGTHWIHIVGSGMPHETIEMAPEQNLDDPAVLTASITRAFQMYPADRHGLILWDHGGAWSGGFGGDTQNGTVSAPTGIDIATTAKSIQTGLAAAGITGSRPLEFLSFDTCLMGGAEVLYQMRDLGKVYIANSELDYGAGWNYEASLDFLVQNPTVSAHDFADNEGMFWDQLHAMSTPQDAVLRSHVDIDATQIDAFAMATRALAAQIVMGAPDVLAEVARNAFPALPQYKVSSLQAGDVSRQLRDFGQILTAIGGMAMDPGLAAAAGAAKTALTNMIIHRSQGTMRETAGQLGVHIELPPPNEYAADDASYTMLAADWNAATTWNTALSALRAAGDSMAPMVTVTGTNLDQPSAANPPGVSAASTASDLAEILVALQLVGPDGHTVQVLGTLADVFGTSGMNPGASWNGQWASISDGMGGTQPLNVRWLFGTARASHGVCALGDGSMPRECDLLYEDGAMQSSGVVLTDASGDATPIPPDEFAQQFPTATFQPAIPTMDMMTGMAGAPAMGTAVPFATGAIALHQAALRAGAYSLGVNAWDIWGNRAPQPVSVAFTLSGPLM